MKHYVVNYMSNKLLTKFPELVLSENIKIGKISSWDMITDPKRLLFVLSRYKFVANMLKEKKNVLEIGCGDGWGIPITSQFIKNIIAIDSDELCIRECKKNLNLSGEVEFKCIDFMDLPETYTFDGVYMMDVIEHIDKKVENEFINKIVRHLTPNGVLIIGTPCKYAKKFESYYSKKYHINRKGYKELYNLLNPYFENVFIFGMNDEVIHTGFPNMSHYLIAMGVGLKGRQYL